MRGSDADDVVEVECVSSGAQCVRLRSQPAIDPRLGVEREEDLEASPLRAVQVRANTHNKSFLSSLSNMKQIYYCVLLFFDAFFSLKRPTENPEMCWWTKDLMF